LVVNRGATIPGITPSVPVHLILYITAPREVIIIRFDGECAYIRIIFARGRAAMLHRIWVGNNYYYYHYTYTLHIAARRGGVRAPRFHSLQLIYTSQYCIILLYGFID